MTTFHATYNYRETPLVNLTFKNNKLVEKENVGPLFKRPDLNWVYDYSLKRLESYLLQDRRISLGRPQRAERYFDGKVTTPFEELRKYLAADNDDYCWVSFEDDPRTFSEVFGGNV